MYKEQSRSAGTSIGTHSQDRDPLKLVLWGLLVVIRVYDRLHAERVHKRLNERKLSLFRHSRDMFGYVAGDVGGDGTREGRGERDDAVRE